MNSLMSYMNTSIKVFKKNHVTDISDCNFLTISIFKKLFTVEKVSILKFSKRRC